MSAYSTEAIALLQRARDEDGLYVPPNSFNSPQIAQMRALAESLTIAGLLRAPSFGVETYELTVAGKRAAWADWKPAPVRLSVEECAWWLTIADEAAYDIGSGANQVHWLTHERFREARGAVAWRDAVSLRSIAAGSLRRAREGRHNNPSVRASLLLWWFCRQAIAAIGRERAR